MNRKIFLAGLFGLITGNIFAHKTPEARMFYNTRCPVCGTENESQISRIEGRPAKGKITITFDDPYYQTQASLPNYDLLICKICGNLYTNLKEDKIK